MDFSIDSGLYCYNKTQLLNQFHGEVFNDEVSLEHKELYKMLRIVILPGPAGFYQSISNFVRNSVH